MDMTEEKSKLANEEFLNEHLEICLGEGTEEEVGEVPPPAEEAEGIDEINGNEPKPEEKEEEEENEEKATAEEEDAENSEEEEPGEEAAEPGEEELSPEEQKKQTEQEERSSKMKKLLRNVLRDEDTEGGGLKDMFNDIQISGEWLKRHWSFLLIVFVCTLLFVTNRYQAQQEIIEESRLKQELTDWKYVWLTQFSELTRSCRQSHIEESLRQRGDSTLKLSKDAPFIIKVK